MRVLFCRDGEGSLHWFDSKIQVHHSSWKEGQSQRTREAQKTHGHVEIAGQQPWSAVLAEIKYRASKEHSLFSRIQPSGMSILCPSFATTEDSSQHPETSPVGKRYTNNSSTKRDVSAEVNIPRDRQVVQLDDMGDLLEPLLELGNLQET